jgi:hypothetical protein
MRVQKVSSQVAWSEREGKLRSAKRSAAALVATLAALLLSLSSNVYGARQTYIQRIEQENAAQKLAGQAHAEDLLSQDWKRWTAADCNVILTYSKWVMSWPYLKVQLRSALPIREALLRQLQFEKHYDSMNPEQRLAFDQKNPPGMLETENDPILLYIEHDVTYSGREGNGSVNSPQQTALELSDGTLVMPIKTEALEFEGESKIVYSFPRVINGKPVLTADDQNLKFVFGKSLVAGRRILPLQDPKKFRIAKDPNDVRLSFRSAELMYNGKLEY